MKLNVKVKQNETRRPVAYLNVKLGFIYTPSGSDDNRIFHRKGATGAYSWTEKEMIALKLKPMYKGDSVTLTYTF
jgi:hypothetical protein